MILCDTNILIEFYKGNPTIVSDESSTIALSTIDRTFACLTLPSRSAFLLLGLGLGGEVGDRVGDFAIELEIFQLSWGFFN